MPLKNPHILLSGNENKHESFASLQDTNQHTLHLMRGPNSLLFFVSQENYAAIVKQKKVFYSFLTLKASFTKLTPIFGDFG